MYEIRYERNRDFGMGNQENRDTGDVKKRGENHEKSGVP